MDGQARADAAPGRRARTERASEDVAIVGMACLFPGAGDLTRYWRNILAGVDAVDDAPADWGAELFHDPASRANDRTYTRRGGFLGDLARFDPLAHGVMPSSVDGGEPDQFLALEVAHEALVDAEFALRPLPGERVGVILGRGTYINRGFTTVVQQGVMVERVLEVVRALHPEHDDAELAALKQALKASLPPFDAEMAPALVPNLVSGRVANRFDFQGTNYIVDGACASSLLALERGIDDLRAHRSDLVLVGGVHASSPPPIFMIFSQLEALSRRGRLRPFDADADGTLLGEGIGVLALKRVADAEAAGDRIYALVKAVGTASDGRALGMLAPRREGEVLALARAYEAACVDPESIGLIEAHGTGTAIGDRTETAALREVFGAGGGAEPWCALGAVKSMIGHCLTASGSAGLIKAALALDQKILPPTLCERLHPDLGLETGPFYVNVAPRPWIHDGATPRRAGVNAFGFGGINAHAILEEYRGPAARAEPLAERPSALFVLAAEDAAGLAARARETAAALDPVTPLSVAADRCRQAAGDGPSRLAVVAGDHADARAKLERAAERLADGGKRLWDRRGIYHTPEPLGGAGRVAHAFPGEGSQYPDMLHELCRFVPEVRRWFDRVDAAFADHPRGLKPSDVIFPKRRPGDGAQRPGGDDAAAERLWRMDLGPEAIFAANQAVAALLDRLALPRDAVVGHSTGEYSALFAAGANRYADEAELFADMRTLNAHFEALRDDGAVTRGRLVTVAGVERAWLERLVAGHERAFVAMDNCPGQVVVAALDDAAAEAIERAVAAAGGLTTRLPFERAYHTPAFQPFCDRLEPFFAQLDLRAPEVAIYSCTTAAPMPADPAEVRRLAVAQWARPVRFRETIERMYDDGVRIFVESGPRNNLTAFTNDILRGRAHLAVAIDTESRGGLVQLHHALAQLAAHHVPFDGDVVADHAAARARHSPYEVTGGAVRRRDDGVPAPALAMGIQPMRLAEIPPAFARREAAAASPAGGEDVASSPAAALAEAPTSAGGGEPGEAPPGTVPAEAAAAVARGAGNAQAAGLRTVAAAAPPSAGPAGPAPEHSGHPPAAGTDGMAAVMAAHLDTMDRFLVCQEAVIRGYFDAAATPTPAPAPPAGPLIHGCRVPSEPARAPAPASALAGATHRTPLPLLASASRRVAAGALHLALRIDLDGSPYLHDHTLGREISGRDPALPALPVVPLTFSMELLAEAALALRAETSATPAVVVGMEEVRATRWIALDRGEVDLEIVASPTETPGRVHTLIRAAASAEGRPRPPWVEATILLDAARPPAPMAPAASYDGAVSAGWTSDDVYGRIMFHGPRLRAVATMDLVAAAGVEGDLTGLPHDALLAGVDDPEFALDPITLDAVGQLVGVWSADRLDRRFHIFPFRVERLEIFRDRLAAGEIARCRGRIELIGDEDIRSDLDVVSADGHLHCRVAGWWDKRFDLPERFFFSRLDPARAAVSRPLAPWPGGAAAPAGVAVTILDDLDAEFLESGGGIWLRVLAGLILDREERAAWRRLLDDATTRRRQDWLRGRAAVKDAVRLCAGAPIPPADIRIATDPQTGAPRIATWHEAGRPAPHVAISHAAGIALAAAVDPARFAGVGVDLERVAPRDDAFLATAFAAAERAAIAASGAARDRVATRFWCAKEAAAKAAGVGLADGVTRFVAELPDGPDGPVAVRDAVTARHLDVAFAGEVAPDVVAALALQPHPVNQDDRKGA